MAYKRVVGDMDEKALKGVPKAASAIKEMDNDDFGESGKLPKEQSLWDKATDPKTWSKLGMATKEMAGGVGDYLKEGHRRGMLRAGLYNEKNLKPEEAEYIKNYKKTAGLAEKFKRDVEQKRLDRIASIAAGMKPRITDPNYGYNFQSPQFRGR